MNIEIIKTRTRIKETRENITYWERQKILRTDRAAVVNAGALVLIWKSQLSLLQAKLAALQSTQPTDCGAPHPYGICPACGKGHGYPVLQTSSL